MQSHKFYFTRQEESTHELFLEMISLFVLKWWFSLFFSVRVAFYGWIIVCGLQKAPEINRSKSEPLPKLLIRFIKCFSWIRGRIWLWFFSEKYWFLHWALKYTFHFQFWEMLFSAEKRQQQEYIDFWFHNVEFTWSVKFPRENLEKFYKP